jgi:2-phosphosulfolactate phosphatase
MTRKLTVHVLPTLFEPSELQGGVAVVIDVLRATTTIAYAMGNGARSIIPCETIEEAVQLREDARDSAGKVNDASARLLIGGERGGEPIPGFDLGNSPSEWSREVVANRDVAFTTTNGTKALLRSVMADRIITGAFANLQAVVDFLLSDARPIHLVCAGTVGNVSSEDCLFAGAVVDRLLAQRRQTHVANDATFELCDAAQLVLTCWQNAANTQDGAFRVLETGSGGRNLMRLGLEADIRIAATLDQVDLVPEYLPQSRRICLTD